MSELFPDTFLRAIERLALDASPAPAAPSAGPHRGRAVGASLDFRDYRPYAPGDDLRRVDWNVYRRSGQFFLRRFEQPTATPVHVLVDDSASMFLDPPATRYAAAVRVALAVAAAALRNGDPLTLHALDGPSLRVAGGRRRLPEVMRRLSSAASSGTATLARGIDALIAAGGRSGVAVVVSDFFDDAGIDALCDALGRIPHRLVLVGIALPSDAAPMLDADAELVDCETGRSTVVADATSTLARYRQAYAAYFDALAAFAKRRGATYARVDAAANAVGELERLFPNGVLRAGGTTR